MTLLRDQQKLRWRHRSARHQCLQLLQGSRRAALAALSGRRPDLVPRDLATRLHGCSRTSPIRSLSGTSVFTDFRRLPSQLYEHWQERPQVLTAIRPALPDRGAAA